MLIQLTAIYGKKDDSTLLYTSMLVVLVVATNLHDLTVRLEGTNFTQILKVGLVGDPQNDNFEMF